MKEAVTVPLTPAEKKWLLGHRYGTDPHCPVEISEGNYDFKEFLAQCRDYTENNWSMPNASGGWVALAKYHVASPDGDGLAEAVKCLEKAQSIDSYDQRAPWLNVYFQAKHLMDAHKETRSLKAYIKARVFLRKLKKSNPALANTVDVQIKDLVKDHGGLASRLYRWGNKLKAYGNKVANWLRNNAWIFIKKRAVNMIDNILSNIASFIAGFIVYHLFVA